MPTLTHLSPLEGIILHRSGTTTYLQGEEYGWLLDRMDLCVSEAEEAYLLEGYEEVMS
jgi:hypothetical protein